MPKEYMSLKTAAEKWCSKAWYIKKACDTGQVPGAALLDGEWIIPLDMPRPPMHLNNEVPELPPYRVEPYR